MDDVKQEEGGEIDHLAIQYGVNFTDLSTLPTGLFNKLIFIIRPLLKQAY